MPQKRPTRSMPPSDRVHRQVIRDTEQMVRDRNAIALADAFGLTILNVTWEDTGRFKGSAVGPNISDMTIQVQWRNP